MDCNCLALDPHTSSQAAQSGSRESFNSERRDERLNGEGSSAAKEVQILIESWWRHYNTIHPHRRSITGRRFLTRR